MSDLTETQQVKAQLRAQALALRDALPAAVRAAALTTVAYVLLFPVGEATLGVWSLSEPLSRGFVVSVAAAVAGAAAWTIFHSARGARWYFAGGLLVGLFILLVR